MISRRFKIFAGKVLSPLVPVRKGRTAIVAKSRVPFAGNLRAIADALLERGADVLIYKDGPIDREAHDALVEAGAKVRTGFSMRNLIALLRSETIMVGHSIRDAHISVRKPGRRVVNLWHGVPLKRIELLMGPGTDQAVDTSRLKLIRQNATLYDWVLASNEADRQVMAQAFGVQAEQVIPAGLPRFDYLREDAHLPPDLARAEARLLAEANGRRIIAYAPTFREETVSPLMSLDRQTLEKLDSVARKSGVVIAIRPHPYDEDALTAVMNHGFSSFIDARVRKYPEAAILLRVCEMLITDYSSIWVDFLLTERPIAALFPDFDHYATRERGFIHDLRTIFPGPIYETWDQIIEALQSCASIDSNKISIDEERRRRELCRQLLLPPQSIDPASHVLLKHLAADQKLIVA